MYYLTNYIVLIGIVNYLMAWIKLAMLKNGINLRIFMF